MEIIWIFIGLTLIGFLLAAYFAKAWFDLRRVVTAYEAHQSTHQELEYKSALMKAEFEALS